VNNDRVQGFEGSKILVENPNYKIPMSKKIVFVGSGGKS
jgi:hypothetical protein